MDNTLTLHFTKSVPYIPDPRRSRPYVTEEDKARAAEVPPHAVPFHCKPWVDGQTAGWTLFYGFITPVTITGTEDGSIAVDNLDQLARETNQQRIIDQFARDHFGIGSGYTLRTPPGFASLIIPATDAPAGLEALTAVIETDWYPRQLFLVFRVPPAGTTIHLDHGMELARVIPIPRLERWALAPLPDDERQEVDEQRDRYLEEERTTSSRWTSASGSSFTHLYKIWSRRHRQADDGQER